MKTDCPDCCYPEVSDRNACGCCEGVESVTPLSTANRPGLSQLAYRIGSHSSFLESMTARLSNSDYPQLASLSTRDTDDPSIALLDGWATVADVLTFYQERIANEGYLRCATERHSILELAKLVGYKLRPGVSASVFLAYTIDENTSEETIIPAGSRVQSVPGPDELPQTFETTEEIKARTKWNNLKPRMTQPQTWDSIFNNDPALPRVYLKGINTNLKSNDPLLIGIGAATPEFYRVKSIIPDSTVDRTLVTLQATAALSGDASGASPGMATTAQLIKALTRPASQQPASSLQFKRRLGDQFQENAEAGFRTLGSFVPALRDTLATATRNAKVTDESNIKVYALRKEASLFGYNAPKRTRILDNGEIDIIGDWPIIELLPGLNGGGARLEHENENQIFLDARYDEIQKNDWIVIETQDTRLTEPGKLITRAGTIDASSVRSEYGLTAPTTRIELDPKWITLTGMDPSSIPIDDDFNAIRSTTVYAQAEPLDMAEEPIETTVCGGTAEQNVLELDDFYDGLESGRWIIVSGERDIAGTSGVRFSELAMLASVTQDVAKVPGDSDFPDQLQPREGENTHTFIKIAEPLEYCFKRDTVTIYGNVVRANHGETRIEILGSGNGSKALQSFDLKQSPLTHVSASNPTGVDSTLSVFVNDLKWHEVDSLAGLQATARNFITRTNDDSETSIIFGNGKEGARLPTGVENIHSEYRNGIGKGGNVKAEQLSLLATRPLGVKAVINPLRASGGADRENRDQARKSAPLAVMALDRLVSVRDYKDFARLYAGIGKSAVVEISSGRRQLVHVTIAGADDIPIDVTSDLFINLRRALHDFGDPNQPIELAVRELMFIVISAKVHIDPDYQWEPVVAELRMALLDSFGFENRELGQDVVLSEVISVMQRVPGVAYVDVDTFGGIPEKQADDLEVGNRRLLTPDEIASRVQLMIETAEELNRPEHRLRVNLADSEDGVIRPAQLAFLTPDVADTLILNQIK